MATVHFSLAKPWHLGLFLHGGVSCADLTPTSFHLLMSEPTSSDAAFGSAPGADPFQTAKASAMKAAEELRTAAATKAQDIRVAAEQRASQFKSAAEQHASEFRDYADQAFTDARDRYSDLRTEGEKYVREKPMQAVLAAFGVGLFVGLILRR